MRVSTTDAARKLPTMTENTWEDIKPGDTITVKRSYARRSFKLVVSTIDTGMPGNGWRFVNGRRLRMDGSPSALRTSLYCQEGERREFIYIDYVKEVTKP
jgi:hypothetical protein